MALINTPTPNTAVWLYTEPHSTSRLASTNIRLSIAAVSSHKRVNNLRDFASNYTRLGNCPVGTGSQRFTESIR